jgi:hypothetical protein
MKRWADEGLVQATRTVGGHRRIPLSEAIRFIRHIGATITHPDILGLQELATLPAAATSGKSAGEALYAALESGDAAVCRGLVQSMYVGGMSVAQICDGPVREAMVRMGELWLHQEWGIAVEHRATDICIQALNQLRFLQPAPRDDAPVALGGAAEEDPYMLPSLACAAVATEAGLRDINLGPRTPLRVMLNAAKHYHASLVWITISTASEPRKLAEDLANMANALQPQRCSVIIGGRSAGQFLPADIPGVHTSGTMAQLSAFARGLTAGSGQPPTVGPDRANDHSGS